MNTLPLEIIEYIAKLDNKVWYLLVQVYKFLSGKDMKREFLLCSTINNSISYDKSVKYKYNSKFHNDNTIDTRVQFYDKVYYLPNGDLHNFEDPCVINCENDQYLHVWFKDNKIERDVDEPAVIHVEKDEKFMGICIVYMYELPLFDYMGVKEAIYSLNFSKIWFKNGHIHRDNDLPAVIKGKVTEYKEWRKNGLLHRDNDLPSVIFGGEFGGQYWHQEGELFRKNGNPTFVKNKDVLHLN